MTEITFSSSFKRAYKKKIKVRKETDDLFWDTVKLFTSDPFHPSLKTHKLSGKLRGLWSYTVEYNLRVVFSFVDGSSKAIFVDLGTHDEVY